MSLHSLAVYLIPDDTARVARAAFPKGNRYLALRDELGPIFADRAFAALFSARGRAALAPAQLALVTILQFAEGLSDVQAADAVRGRIDWKYLLSLELDDPGFDASVLCEFRARLRRACWIPCSPCAASAGCSRPGGGSGPIRLRQESDKGWSKRLRSGSVAAVANT